MLNKDIYLKDPVTHKLVNEGVASVKEDNSAEALKVLRYELETFVCDGQYEKGLEHILETYIKNINEPYQPGVWVSGFYGSGKSHFLKMLRYLWVDTDLGNGVTARNLTNLKPGIKDALHELTIQGNRFGGLHAASGTLGSSASGSVRLALLNIIFKSVGLPGSFPVAKFILWLRSEGIYEEVHRMVTAKGAVWEDELNNFILAEDLHQVLVELKPNLFANSAVCTEVLNERYRIFTDIDSDEMIKTIRQAVSKDGKFPLTFIGLDEIQQYIGENVEKAYAVQEVVEACCKNFAGKLLFVGTGQTGITTTPYLKKLEARFTIRVELSDTDVENVVRQVILAKKPGTMPQIEKTMEQNIGEISRHLQHTIIRHKNEDIGFFVQDYPVLPIRRRFWEQALKVLDLSGTESQLRNQLSMIHKAIQSNLDKPLGSVLPADYLYFDAAEKLLQIRQLPRKVYEKTMRWKNGSEEETLLARACGLIFLINKISSNTKEIGITATSETVADLMVDDINKGSNALRAQLPRLLGNCEILMKVGDEYRIQTEESLAWNDAFQSRRSQLNNELHQIEMERTSRIQEIFKRTIKVINPLQGNSKVSRSIHTIYDSSLPPDCDNRICLWLRNGWETDDNSVKIDALRAGNQSPTIYVFIPRHAADDLRHNLLDFKAAEFTLEQKGPPSGPDGVEARAAMETIKYNSLSRVNEILQDAFTSARVFQAGGQEITGNNLYEMLVEAIQNAIQRLYPRFNDADHTGWAKVYERAKSGSPDALKAVGFDGEPLHQNVCKQILSFIASENKGAEIRQQFEGAPFGWSGDAVDGAIQVLLIANLIIAKDDRGQLIDPRELERKQIGKFHFKVELKAISVKQKIEIRKLYQVIGMNVQQNEEVAQAPAFIQKVLDLAVNAGGDAPKPLSPDVSHYRDLRLSTPNEQLLFLYNERAHLQSDIQNWKDLAVRISKRWPDWERLVRILEHADDLKVVQEARQQVEAIKQQRLLLTDPDPIHPLLKSIESAVREELISKHLRYNKELVRLLDELRKDSVWAETTSEDQQTILLNCGIVEMSALKLNSFDELLQTLKAYPLQSWDDRITALGRRFAQAREEALKLSNEKVQTVELPKFTLRNAEDLNRWLKEVETQLKDALKNGAVIIR